MPDDTQAAQPADQSTAPIGDIQVPPASRWDHEIFDPDNPGKFKPKWQETLPDAFNDHKSFLSTFDSLDGMVKSHKDMMTQARNKGGVKPLTAESTAEDVAAYRKAMGIPDTPYEFDKPEKLPEGVEWREDRVKDFGKWAQENNLTPAQAKQALDLHMRFIADDMKAITEQQQAAFEQNLAAEKEQLRTEFGGKLEGEVMRAKQVALKYNLPIEAMDPNSKRFLGVTMLKVFAEFGKALGEANIPSQTVVTNTDPYRQATAMREKGHPEYEALKRGDKGATDRYIGLLRMAKEQGLLPADA